MYFTDQKAVLGYRPFSYRRPYLCNRNSYNVDTYQAHVFGADKSSDKIWYCVLPICVFYRPESAKFGHIQVLNGSVKEGFGITKAIIIFSDAPY